MAWQSQEKVPNSRLPPWEEERTQCVSGVSAFWRVAPGTGISCLIWGAKGKMYFGCLGASENKEGWLPAAA